MPNYFLLAQQASHDKSYEESSLMGPMENGSLVVFKQHIRTLKTCEVHMLAAH